MLEISTSIAASGIVNTATSQVTNLMYNITIVRIINHSQSLSITNLRLSMNRDDN